MLALRASAEYDGREIDLSVVTAVDDGIGGGGGGIANGEELIRFANAVLGHDEVELAAARTAIAGTLGGAALADTAGVVSLFNAIVRVADSTGIPVEEQRAVDSADFRAAIGVDDFAAAGEKGSG
ncbi:MAG: hypothetical protein HOI02_09540 [Rhodospirillaceae bacterium]|nr:hypothetical protein [Rhodospirillaceae bacterium]